MLIEADMDKFKQYGLLAIAFIACLFAVGFPYWSISYSQAQLPSALMGAGIVVVAFASLALRSCRVAPIWLVTIIVGGSVPAAVMARVTVETIQDPTSHNLWPLEIMIALVMGVFWAVVGAIAGAVVARLVAPLLPTSRPAGPPG